MDIFGANPAPLANVIAFPKKTTGTENRQWRLVPSRVSGYYFVQSLLNGFVLGILGADTDPATQLIAFPRKTTGVENQVRKFT